MERIEKPKSLDEQAYLQIKDAVLRCVLRPGEFVAEVRLAEDLGVSKTPIRKALARLQQEGFLITVPYKGHFVADVSIKDVVEIYELRQIMECYLVRETAKQFTASELAEMELSLQSAQEALDSDEFAHYVALNREFHHVFDQKYGHQRISDVLTNLDEHVQRIIFYALQNEYGDLLDRQRDDHRLIFEAIKEADVDLAGKLMKNHLAEFCNELVIRMNVSSPELN